LERIHSHLLWLGVAGHEVGFDTLLMYTWRDREVVMDLLNILTGNRVNYGINTIGGVRRDVPKEKYDEILKAVDILEERTRYYIQVATEEVTFIKRLAGVGRLTHDEVVKMCVVGPTGRASGVPRDVRRDDPYAAYAVVRVLELMESYKIIRQLLKQMPDGPIVVKAPRKVPAGEAVSRYEAPRGEDIHYVKGNGTEKPERVKLRAPTMANVQAVKKMVENYYLADLPITVAAIDPCFSCTDRSIEVSRIDSGRTDIMNWESLRKYSMDWYAAQGVKF
jgi:NADH-quinone oxidoreductase subunit D